MSTHLTQLSLACIIVAKQKQMPNIKGRHWAPFFT